MSKSTIEWTEQTWNPVGGCAKKSPGCRNCYAVRVARRLGGNPNNDIRAHYEPLTVIQGGQMNWSGEVTLNERVLLEPLKRKQPTTYFISLSDLFYDKRPDEDIDRVLSIMAGCRQHTFQILTKYADRMLAYFKRFKPDGQGWVTPGGLDGPETHCPIDAKRWPLPNVHLGVSTENQQYADERIPLLLRTPAAVRFVSYEPALGPVDFEQWIWPTCVSTKEEHDQEHDGGMWCDERSLDQIIFGFESGPGARPAEIEWARSTKNQCVEAGVDFFLKQYADAKGKKISLPELDGQQWMQLPRVVNHGMKAKEKTDGPHA